MGIATFVMRSRQYLAAIGPQGEVLSLETMFFADEVRDPIGEIEQLPAQHSFLARDLDMAVTLIDSMTTQHRPNDLSGSVISPVAAAIAPPGMDFVNGTPDAVGVGVGPNGLAAAFRLAAAGLRVQVVEREQTAGGGLVDMTDAIENQIERFAPGFRDTVLARHIRPAPQMEQHNPNDVGGEISNGEASLWQMLARPVPRWNTYKTPARGTYLASAATPPGPAVHGMSGDNAARVALREVFGIRELLPLRPAAG